ncbi:MAG TPA: glycosyltransferase family 9 protein [Chthoniobacterales bacterium]|nr:glycosyltransferase family 9 protein [Chthoniobacterales bacterium]
MNRILIIRGGAIGDFILTLPALKALRDAFPSARVEILGYKHIAAIAENRFYADAVQSIEYGALSAFFAKGGELDPKLREYLGSFDLVISYLFDPDGVFVENLRRAGARTIVYGPARVHAGSHATQQLAAAVERVGIKVEDYVARVFPSADDISFAGDLLQKLSAPVIALHIGSGSAQKNWPVENWLRLGDSLLERGNSLIVVSGEADEPQLAIARHHWANAPVLFITNLPLPKLAAVLGQCVFIGHDSGISHLAAAAGAKCVLLFGPTDPEVWAPQGVNVRILRGPDSDLRKLEYRTVLDALESLARP